MKESLHEAHPTCWATLISLACTGVEGISIPQGPTLLVYELLSPFEKGGMLPFLVPDHAVLSSKSQQGKLCGAANVACTVLQA